MIGTGALKPPWWARWEVPKAPPAVPEYSLPVKRAPPWEASQPHNLGWAQQGECLFPQILKEVGVAGNHQKPIIPILGQSGCLGVF